LQQHENTRYLAGRTRESGRATADFTKECQGIGDSELAKILPSADSAVGTGIFGIGLRRAANWMMAARARLFDDVAQLLLSTCFVGRVSVLDEQKCKTETIGDH